MDHDFSIIFHGFLVFFMQLGFVSLEVGSGRAKNVRNILLKNTVDVMLCGLCWWFWGFAFAYGDSAEGVIGYTNFAFTGDGETSRTWFFSFTFALVCVTIVSGSLAERTHLAAYPAITVVIATLVHPIMVHWAWSEGAWIDRISPCKFQDFAGGTLVHVIGGLMGLIGAYMCGPRLGRFEDGAAKELPGHDTTFVTLGTFMLWFGWYGFNCGSVFVYTHPTSATYQRVAMNTTLAPCAAGLTALLLHSHLSGTFDIRHCCNGLLSGLVVVTSNAGFIDQWAAVVLGLLAGATYVGSSAGLLRLGIDDPLDSTAVHFINGVIGTLLTGMFSKPEYAQRLGASNCGGFIYSGAHSGMQLGIQLLGVVVIIVWTALWGFAVCYLLRRYNLLRIDQATELAGIDNIEHGGPAYEWNMPAHNTAAGMERGADGDSDGFGQHHGIAPLTAATLSALDASHHLRNRRAVNGAGGAPVDDPYLAAAMAGGAGAQASGSFVSGSHVSLSVQSAPGH